MPFWYHFLGQSEGFKAARNIIKPAIQASDYNGVCKDLLFFFPGKGTKAVKDQDLASGRELVTISSLRQREVRNAEPREPNDGGHQAVGPES